MVPATWRMLRVGYYDLHSPPLAWALPCWALCSSKQAFRRICQPHLARGAGHMRMGCPGPHETELAAGEAHRDQACERQKVGGAGWGRRAQPHLPMGFHREIWSEDCPQRLRLMLGGNSQAPRLSLCSTGSLAGLLRKYTALTRKQRWISNHHLKAGAFVVLQVKGRYSLEAGGLGAPPCLLEMVLGRETMGFGIRFKFQHQ